MSRTRLLLRNMNVINLVLAGLIALSLVYVARPFLRTDYSYPLPRIQRAATEEPIAPQEAEPEKGPSPADYALVAEQNLFHPERKIPVEKKAEAPLPKPDFILYGTLITENVSIAYMEDLKAPVTTPGRGKRQSSLAAGDSLSGFVLKKVEADRVTMARGEEVIIVMLDDHAKPKKRTESATSTLLPAVQSPADRGRAQTPQVRNAPQEPAAAVQHQPEEQPPAAAVQQPQERRAPLFGRFRNFQPGR